MINGIDVSVYQEVMDWQKAKDHGVVFAFIRACYGLAKDKQFDRNWAEAKRVGIYRSAYGWVLDPVNQINNAAFFWRLIKNDPGELPPTCDFELATLNGKVSEPGFSALQLFMRTMEGYCKRKPILYTGTGYWNRFAEHATQYWVLDYPLWIAQYNNAAQPTLTKPFTTYKFWQWSGVNNFGNDYGVPKAGAPIDMDRFNGSDDDLKALMATGNIPIPITPLEQRVSNLEVWARTQGYK